MTRILAAAIVAFILIPSTAQARHHHHRYNYRQQIIRTDVLPVVAHQRHYRQRNQAVAYYGDGNIEYNSGHIIGGRPAGCPRQYCGCETSIKVFGRIIPSLNLASNWFRFPRTAPGPGMVAVRNHHVMYIMAYNNGAATVYDPNSGGHATRVHTRSLRGYAIVNPHGGSRMAAL